MLRDTKPEDWPTDWPKDLPKLGNLLDHTPRPLTAQAIAARQRRLFLRPSLYWSPTPLELVIKSDNYRFKVYYRPARERDWGMMPISIQRTPNTFTTRPYVSGIVSPFWGQRAKRFNCFGVIVPDTEWGILWKVNNGNSAKTKKEPAPTELMAGRVT